MMGDGRAVKPIAGRHVLLALIGFFGLMLIANGFFVYFALATFSAYAAYYNQARTLLVVQSSQDRNGEDGDGRI
jgi:hypothetical protein